MQPSSEWSTLDIVPDALAIFDRESRLVFMNAATRRLLAQRGAAGAADVTDAHRLFTRVTEDPGALTALRRGLREVLDGLRPRFDLDVRHRGGGDDDDERWFAVTLAPHAGGVLVQQREVTERVRDANAHARMEAALRESEERFRVIAELSDEGLVLTERGIIIHANTALARILGYGPNEVIGMSSLELTAHEDRERARAHIAANSDEAYEARCLRKDGTTFPCVITGRHVPYQGRIVRGTTIRDVTAQRQAEEMLRRNIAQEEQLRAQALRLAELSTPLIPITDEIVALPLIGQLDAARAAQAMESLLQGIVQRRVHTAIVDITGVPTVDTAVAAALLQVARAVRLLGAEVVLTGIRPEVAQTLVGIEADLSGIVTRGTLQNAIVHALQAAGKRALR